VERREGEWEITAIPTYRQHHSTTAILQHINTVIVTVNVGENSTSDFNKK